MNQTKPPDDHHLFRSIQYIADVVDSQSDVLRDAAGRLVVLRVVVRVPAVLVGVELLAVAPQRVGLLAVHGVVADGQLVVGHAQRHHEAHHQAHQGGHHQVPGDDEERAAQLLPELDAAAVEGALGVADGQEQGAQRRVREEPRGDAAQDPGHGVGVEHAQGVVHLLEQAGALVHHHHREPRDAAREHTHQDRRPTLDKTCRAEVDDDISYSSVTNSNKKCLHYFAEVGDAYISKQ